MRINQSGYTNTDCLETERKISGYMVGYNLQYLVLWAIIGRVYFFSLQYFTKFINSGTDFGPPNIQTQSKIIHFHVYNLFTVSCDSLIHVQNLVDGFLSIYRHWETEHFFKPLK